MKRQLTEIEKIEKQISKLNSKKWDLEKELKTKKEEFESYIRRHKSLSFDAIVSSDYKTLDKIYKYFDDKYPIDFQGGLRNDHRGMKLYYWLYDKDDYLILHLTSNHDNLFFSGSTSWLVYAPTLEEKIERLKRIKKDMLEILKGGK